MLPFRAIQSKCTGNLRLLQPRGFNSNFLKTLFRVSNIRQACCMWAGCDRTGLVGRANTVNRGFMEGHQVMLINPCVIAAASKVQEKTVLFCIPLPQRHPGCFLSIKSFLTCWFSLMMMDSNWKRIYTTQGVECSFL